MHGIRANVFTWRGLSFFLMALLFWYIAIPILAPRLISVSQYLDVRSVLVVDSLDGRAPAVVVDRDINRNYTGSFVSTLRKIDETEGLILDWCPSGERTGIQYHADAPYPRLDLNWWMGSPPAVPCPIIPGTYQLRITWSVPTLFGMATLNKTVESLPFRVAAPINDPEAP